MEKKDLLLGHMEDVASSAIKKGCALSKFLTPAEAQDVKTAFARRRDVALSFDGGYPDAERTRAVFVNPDWGEYVQASFFSALSVAYRPQDTLGHRDILGALMALGIERDTVGDIIADATPAALICLPEISGYIADNLTKAGRVGVTVTPIFLGDLPAKTETLHIKTGTVASLRLDAVLGIAFGLSRSRTSELIAAGLVSLNHELCLSPAKTVSVGAVLSVRKWGRARLAEVGGTSKKGRIFIKIECRS